MGDTPVPIPNTMVKTQAADDTALETVWESRWPPDQKENNEGKEKLSTESLRSMCGRPEESCDISKRESGKKKHFDYRSFLYILYQ